MVGFATPTLLTTKRRTRLLQLADSAGSVCLFP